MPARKAPAAKPKPKAPSVVFTDRDYIPADDDVTPTEKARADRSIWGRDYLEAPADFLPDGDTETQPLGDAQSQLVEAQKLSKGGVKAPSEEARAKRLAGLNEGDAIEFLQSLSDYERLKHLPFENRPEVLKHFGIR